MPTTTESSTTAATTTVPATSTTAASPPVPPEPDPAVDGSTLDAIDGELGALTHDADTAIAAADAAVAHGEPTP